MEENTELTPQSIESIREVTEANYMPEVIDAPVILLPIKKKAGRPKGTGKKVDKIANAQAKSDRIGNKVRGVYGMKIGKIMTAWGYWIKNGKTEYKEKALNLLNDQRERIKGGPTEGIFEEMFRAKESEKGYLIRQ